MGMYTCLLLLLQCILENKNLITASFSLRVSLPSLPNLKKTEQ